MPVKPDVMDGVPEEAGVYFIHYEGKWRYGEFYHGHFIFEYQKEAIVLGPNEIKDYKFSERIRSPGTEEQPRQVEAGYG